MQICENNKDCYYKQETADLLQELAIERSEAEFQQKRYARLKKALHTKNKNERNAGARKFAEHLKKYAIKTNSPAWGLIDFVEVSDIDRLLKAYE